MTPAGFPHSDIHGSTLESSSPWLFAGFRVLHRLLVPRHPPCALCSLTCFAPFDAFGPVNHSSDGSSSRFLSSTTNPTDCLAQPLGWTRQRSSPSLRLFVGTSSRRPRRKMCYSVRLSQPQFGSLLSQRIANVATFPVVVFIYPDVRLQPQRRAPLKTGE